MLYHSKGTYFFLWHNSNRGCHKIMQREPNERTSYPTQLCGLLLEGTSVEILSTSDDELTWLGWRVHAPTGRKGLCTCWPSGCWPKGGASARLCWGGRQGKVGRALSSKKGWHDVVGRLHGSSTSCHWMVAVTAVVVALVLVRAFGTFSVVSHQVVYIACPTGNFVFWLVSWKFSSRKCVGNWAGWSIGCIWDHRL